MTSGGPAHAPSPATGRARPSWWAVADCIGHCVLVFALVPSLASLPRWLAFEATNRLNLSDPVVLAFLPMRGFVTLVTGFLAGAVPGVVAGAIAGALLATWTSRRGVASGGTQRLVVGAIVGGIASAVMMLVFLAVGVALGEGGVPPLATLAFEFASGLACGALAVPGASRLLAAPRVPTASQRTRPSMSASQ